MQVVLIAAAICYLLEDPLAFASLVEGTLEVATHRSMQDPNMSQCFQT